MRAIVCLTLCVLAVLAADPPRPQIPRTFETKAAVQFQHPNGSVFLDGEGHWMYDLPGNKAVEFFFFHQDRSQDIFRLQRYDLGKDFLIHFESSNRSCDVQAVTGNMPDEFAWINNATFVQTKNFKHLVLDIWEFTMGYAKMSIAVNHHRTSEPVFYARTTPNNIFHVEFLEFKPVKPRDPWFVVPSKCESSEDPIPHKLGCVARSTIISRAQSWVDAHVPYNQEGDYGGYREDCSGYVSMSWQAAKPGYTTSTLHEIASPISKDQLSPGDVLLCAGEHVVLFGGWADGARTSYLAFEETRPGEGTVKRNDPYPYFYNTACFKPYRYNAVC